MNMMDNLRDYIALQLVRIEDKCREWGMSGVDSTSLLVRDRNNSDMSIWLSNDPDVDPLVWYPGNELPDMFDWVLGVLHPLRNSDYQEPDYYALIAYDHVGGRWRSQMGEVHKAEVVKWAHLPTIGGENGG